MRGAVGKLVRRRRWYQNNLFVVLGVICLVLVLEAAVFIDSIPNVAFLSVHGYVVCDNKRSPMRTKAAAAATTTTTTTTRPIPEEPKLLSTDTLIPPAPPPPFPEDRNRIETKATPQRMNVANHRPHRIPAQQIDDLLGGTKEALPRLACPFRTSTQTQATTSTSFTSSSPSPSPPRMTTTTTTTKAATSEKLLLPAVASFSPLEFWCLTKLDRWYALSQSVRCPFFRRRYGDALDVFEAFLRGVVIRAECLPMMGPPQAHRPPPATKRRHDATAKHTELTPEELLERVEKDWKADTGKGYYVTGKLTASIYRNDCLFLGPDPDLPLRSLRKYVGVASHLFDYRTSSATLESLEIVGKKKNNNNNYINDGCDPDNHKTKSKEPSLYETSETNGFPDGEETTTTILVARWKLRGVLRLPWKPSLPLLSGETIYHIGEDGLIACHEESWDCSAAKAFCYTFLPALANRIWRGEQKTKKKKAMVERERD